MSADAVDDAADRLEDPPLTAPSEVMVSWAHKPDSGVTADTWRDTVLRFVAALRRPGGLLADLDLVHLTEPVDWTRWGPLRVQECARTLIVVNAAWRERFEGTNTPTEGPGAAAEASVLLGIFDQDQDDFRQRVRLVILPGASEDDVPLRLRGVPRFRITDFTLDGLDALLRTLHDRPRYVLPPPSAVPPLPPDTVAAITENAEAAVRVVTGEAHLPAQSTPTVSTLQKVDTDVFRKAAREAEQADDYRQAEHLYQQLVEAGVPGALAELARLAERGGQDALAHWYDERLERLRREAADAGDLEAVDPPLPQVQAELKDQRALVRAALESLQGTGLPAGSRADLEGSQLEALSEKLDRALALLGAHRSAPPASGPGTADTAPSQRRWGPAQAARVRHALSEPSNPVPVDALGRDPALRDLASSLADGEVRQLGAAALSGAQRRRLGAVLGLRLTQRLFDQRTHARQQHVAESVTTDALAVLHGLGDEEAAEVLTGLAATAPDSLPRVIVDHALEAGAVSTTALVHAGRIEVVQALTAPGARWDQDRVLDVLEAGAERLSFPQARDLAAELDWSALSPAAALPRACAALVRYPAVFLPMLKERITIYAQSSTVGHERQVQALVTAALEVKLLGTLREPQHLVEVLVDSPSPRLHDLAAQWLEVAVPTAAVVDLAVRAHTDDGTGRYSTARKALARVLCSMVQAPAGVIGDKVEALSLARHADPAQARAAAFTVLPGAHRPVRYTAAQVIASTPAAQGDEVRLVALIAQEPHQSVRELLELARRRLVSGSVGEALVNAVELVGAQGSLGHLDPAVCLPDPRAHEAFRVCVDQARTSATESPKSRLNAMINIADLLGEQAIAAYWLRAGTAKEKEKAEKLRAGAADKEDIGFLVIQQNLVQRLGWLPYLAALRESRTAHPAPLGSTTPLELTEADAVSAVPLLRRIFEGWVQQMYTTAGQPLPPVTR